MSRNTRIVKKHISLSFNNHSKSLNKRQLSQQYLGRRQLCKKTKCCHRQLRAIKFGILRPIQPGTPNTIKNKRPTVVPQFKASPKKNSFNTFRRKTRSGSDSSPEHYVLKAYTLPLYRVRRFLKIFVVP